MLIKYDFHNHTNVSYCASPTATTAAAIQGLEELGFESIGFCDHLYPETDIGGYQQTMRAEIFDCKTKMRVYLGVEVDMLAPGVLDADAKRLRGFDYISVACPHYQNPRVSLPIKSDYCVIAQNALDYFISAAAIPFADIIVHPFDSRGLSKLNPDFEIMGVMKLLNRVNYLPIVELLISNNIAVELTERLCQEDYFAALEPFLTLCREEGVKFSFGSDSHTPEHLGSIRKATDAIHSLKITEDMLWKPL